MHPALALGDAHRRATVVHPKDTARDKLSSTAVPGGITAQIYVARILLNCAKRAQI